MTDRNVLKVSGYECPFSAEDIELMREARRYFSPYVRPGQPRQPGNVIYGLVRLVDRLHADLCGVSDV